MARTHSTAQLDGCSPPGFSLMDFFGQRGSAGPSCPAHLQEDKGMELGEGTQLSLLPPHIVEAVAAQPRGSSEPLPGSAPGPGDGSHTCGSWREMKHFKHLLWLWKGVVNPHLASSIEHGAAEVCSVCLLGTKG